jgi:hypothetical protein
VSCMVDALKRQVILTIEDSELPMLWEVFTPAGRALLTADTWDLAGRKAQIVLDLPDDVLPPYLDVRWDGDNGSEHATWIANVEDRGALPPPAELRELSVHILLGALASSRPLPVALEEELRRAERTEGSTDGADLDPLRRFDDSSLLLRRTRNVSLALWRLQDRLQRPASSLDALRWRLSGSLGPIAIADGLVAEASEDRAVPGEAHFLLAELALTVARVDWRIAAGSVEWSTVRGLVSDVVDVIDQRRLELPLAPHPTLDAYVHDALMEARK